MHYLFLLLAFFAPLAALHSQEPLLEQIDAKAVKAWFAAEFAANLQRHAGNPDILVRRGIVANRQSREVHVQAVATGQATDPVEFMLVTEFGRDYEALAVTLAKPSEIHEALVFIGLKPGYTVNYPELVFWPKGERVNIFLEWQDDEEADGAMRSLRVEKAVTDLRTGQPMPEVGFMFTGSVLVNEETEDGDEPVQKYAADLGGEIVSTFNERWTVLDVPYRAEQGQTYGQLVPNTQHIFKIAQRLYVKMTPAAPVGESLLRDFRLAIRAAAGTTAATPADLRFHITEPDGKVVVADGTFDALLEFLQGHRAAGHDLYVQIRYDRDLPVTPLVEFAGMLETLATNKVLRMEPVPDEIYHQAFIPDPRFYNRQERVLQPLEVFLRAEPQTLLVTHETLGDRGSTYQLEQLPFSGPQELKALLMSREQWPSRTLFFMITPDTTYGQLLDHYLPIRQHFPIIFVLFHKAGEPIPTSLAPRSVAE